MRTFALTQKKRKKRKRNRLRKGLTIKMKWPQHGHGKKWWRLCRSKLSFRLERQWLYLQGTEETAGYKGLLLLA